MTTEIKAVTKTEQDGEHPANHYLVVEDPEKPSTWHLRVRGMDGKPDHRLMGAAWAALHEGYRGNTYDGPNKQEAISKLTALYRSEKIPTPGKEFDPYEQKMLYSIPLQIGEFKSAGDNWEVSGYVSTFDNEDLGRDIVRAGAFKRTLKSGPKVRFLRDHDPRLLLGVPLKLQEDSKGLFGQFKISKTKLGEETHELIVDKALDSFSFGYHADDYEIDEKENIRYLNEITLYEASLVSMPMNQEAIVTGFKDYLALLGVDPTWSMTDKIRAFADGMKELTNDLQGLAKDASRPLSETKRKELTELLELCSGMDAVRSDLQSVLTTAPSNLVSPKLIKYELAERRKRLADILGEP